MQMREIALRRAKIHEEHPDLSLEECGRAAVEEQMWAQERDRGFRAYLRERAQ
jgi:hypothetical protein